MRAAAEQIRPVAIGEYVAVLDAEIQRGQVRGLPGDWYGLHRRLDAIARQVAGHETLGQPKMGLPWVYSTEYECLIRVLPQVLLCSVLEAVVAALRPFSEGTADDLGIWAPLDIKPFAQRVQCHRHRALWAEAGVVDALARHANKPSHRRIQEGIRALQDLGASRAALEPRLDPKTVMDRGEQLAEALVEVLPPTARSLLSRVIEFELRQDLEGKPIEELDLEQVYWHLRLPGVGYWSPVFAQLRCVAKDPDPLGAWFREVWQEIYEEWYQAAQRVSTGRTERAKLSPAVAVEERGETRSVDYASALEGDANLKQDGRVLAQPELQRAQEDDLGPGARTDEKFQRDTPLLHRDTEQAQRPDDAAGGEPKIGPRRQRRSSRESIRQDEKKIFDQGQTGQRPHLAEVHRREAATRADPLEMKRWARYVTHAPDAAPALPSRAHVGWAEAQWQKWCRQRGVDPTDFTAEFRESFMHHL